MGEIRVGEKSKLSSPFYLFYGRLQSIKAKEKLLFGTIIYTISDTNKIKSSLAFNTEISPFISTL